MPPAVPPSFAGLMAPLRLRYLENLSATCDELTDLLHTVQETNLSSQLIEKLTLLAHNMSGSGLSYGFPAISKTARALEESLDGPLVDHGGVITRLQILIGTCEVLLNRPVKVSLAEFTNIVQPEQPALPTVLLITGNREIRFSPLFTGFATLLSARTAAEAIDNLRTVLPDLILLDDSVPGSTASPLLEELRTNPDWGSVPVIVLTFTKDVEAHAAMRALHVLDIIPLPIAPAAAAEKIKAHLERLQLTVMIVDDDRNICEMLSRAFAADGIRVQLACSGPEALAQMKVARPNGVLLDYQLPGMSGEDVLKAMKEDPALMHIPAAFITAHHTAEDVVRILKLGAVDYIIKPIDPQMVLKRCRLIADVLRKRQSRKFTP